MAEHNVIPFRITGKHNAGAAGDGGGGAGGAAGRVSATSSASHPANAHGNAAPKVDTPRDIYEQLLDDTLKRADKRGVREHALYYSALFIVLFILVGWTSVSFLIQ